MNYKHPLISCICITGNRPLVLQRAIICFARQDYPNTELVISYPEEDLLSKTIIDQINSVSAIKIIRIVRPQYEKPCLTKNNAIEICNGDYVCFWNDEHWHHVNRLSDQYIVIKDSPFKASILMHILLYDFHQQKTYHSAYWEWQETLFCERKTLLEAAYIDIEREDDSGIIHFLSYKNFLFHFTEASHLYIYIGYGTKDKDQKLFNSYCKDGEIMEDINETVQDVIQLEYYLN
ncbi:glycosyltransferase family A protein [Pedobacter sp. FW305-3-2-15-E-R2A2]|uniref:glycosyltransferase family A protein n=1 Tax=Pedobacter sp. FW305-3-2-15-E-R2A2 TaxID=3140251 RepID=UPI00314019C5